MIGVHDERRFAPAVREWHPARHQGPTAEWARHQRELADRKALIRLLWREHWAAKDISQFLGVSMRWVYEVVGEGSR